MSEGAYNALVAEHFGRPRNTGRLEAADDVIAGRAGSVAGGTRFELTARVRDDRIVETRFTVYGCPHSIAAGSLVSERLLGATRDQLQSWSWQAAAQELQVPAAKRGRLLVLEDAVHALAAAWRQNATQASVRRAVRS